MMKQESASYSYDSTTSKSFKSNKRNEMMSEDLECCTLSQLIRDEISWLECDLFSPPSKDEREFVMTYPSILLHLIKSTSFSPSFIPYRYD